MAKQFSDLSDEEQAEALVHGAKYLMAEKRLVKSRGHQRFIWVIRLIAICAVIAVTVLVPWLVHYASSTVPTRAVIAIGVVVFVVSCSIVKRTADWTILDVTNRFANKIAQDSTAAEIMRRK